MKQTGKKAFWVFAAVLAAVLAVAAFSGSPKDGDGTFRVAFQPVKGDLAADSGTGYVLTLICYVDGDVEAFDALCEKADAEMSQPLSIDGVQIRESSAARAYRTRNQACYAFSAEFLKDPQSSKDVIQNVRLFGKPYSIGELHLLEPSEGGVSLPVKEATALAYGFGLKDYDVTLDNKGGSVGKIRAVNCNSLKVEKPQILLNGERFSENTAVKRAIAELSVRFSGGEDFCTYYFTPTVTWENEKGEQLRTNLQTAIYGTQLDKKEIRAAFSRFF